MPRLKAEDIKQLAEPIIIEAGVLNDKEYVVEKITTDLMDEVTALGKEKGLDAPIKQLALLLGADVKDLKGIDIRKIGKVLKFITNTVEESLEAPKNA